VSAPLASLPLCRPCLSLSVALFEPDIPQNAGSVLRTCACFGVAAEIIEPAGFPFDERRFRRAGMDYLSAAVIRRHVDFAAFEVARRAAGRRLVLATTAGAVAHTAIAFRADDVLLFGRESAGVTAEVAAAADAAVRVPLAAGMRSLNVAVTASIVLAEALRQLGAFPQAAAGG
jgi:tRNA (cytidine/uridine-2'-O-)-methyltransferase